MLNLYKYPNIEHVGLSDKKYDQIIEMISKSYPDSCIVEILRIYTDPDKETLFMNHFNNFPNAKIVELFHGTGKDSIESISQEGFIVSKNKISAFGKGTYFSNIARIAVEYGTKAMPRQAFGTKKTLKPSSQELTYVILADVVLGTDAVVGNQYIDNNYLTQYSKPSHYVNDLRNPSYICVPHDNGAIPRYIICFHKETQVD